MDRRVTPPKRVISSTWGPPLQCKQALNVFCNLVVIAEASFNFDQIGETLEELIKARNKPYLGSSCSPSFGCFPLETICNKATLMKVK